MKHDQHRIIALLREGSRFLITSHVKPDGDSVASQCALQLLLEGLGKRVVVFNSDAVPRVYRFVPGADRIVRRAPRSLLGFDALLVLDCGDPSRASGLLRRKPPIPVVNLDHHATNSGFGDLNWVLPEASSSAEVVYRLAELLRVKPAGPLAEAIYVGILTDTGSFRHSNATSRAFHIASLLVRGGIDPGRIAQAVYDSMEYETLPILGAKLAGMRRTGDGRVVWITLSRKDLGRLSSPSETEEWVSYPRSVDSALIAVSFKETGSGEVRLSFRSKGEIDVATLASQWGGGGHRNAAGATFPGSLDRAEREVIAAAQKHLGTEPLPRAPRDGAPKPGRGRSDTTLRQARGATSRR